MKFTDEELSRILSAAAVPGGMVEGGLATTGLPCCAVQAASLEFYAHDAYLNNQDVAVWFDGDAVRLGINEDPDAMLRAIEEKGWA